MASSISYWTASTVIRLEIRGGLGHRARAVTAQLPFLGLAAIGACEATAVYFLDADLDDDALEFLCARLLRDPVTETAAWMRDPRDNAGSPAAVEVARKRGVTDTEARVLENALVRLGLPPARAARATRYEFAGAPGEEDLHRIARDLLCNATTERYAVGWLQPEFEEGAGHSSRCETIPVRDLTDVRLAALSRDRGLALSLDEMQVIRQAFRDFGRDPTDVELETLAQTWSEHCQHKTFKARIRFRHEDPQGRTIGTETIDGIFDTCIRAVNCEVAKTWLVSVFEDDAGVIRFTDDLDLAFKVETHNHPSALDPFGGAHTGVGGVVRDVLGVSARPIAATDVLCFGPPDLPDAEVPAGTLHPRRIRAGVVRGIGDYGNKLGLPTLSGAIVYDRGYVSNPLVYCGCIGIAPHGAHPTAAEVGDLVVALGGRTGLDGLHGATFSSADLAEDTRETQGSAVQIGDPILEKGLMELLGQARDEQLYTAVTDCGAGGFSSAIGEMGEELGVEVHLDRIRVKYPDLAPWELWLSEAQERMVVAVPPARLARLQALADHWEVELSVLGKFTGDRELHIRHEGRTVGRLPMDFVHHGWPRPELNAFHREPSTCDPAGTPWTDGDQALKTLLTHPSVASKEAVIRTFDHEVRGGTLVRPLTGPCQDGPADGVVFEPLEAAGSGRAVAVAQGINPMLGLHDPYAMGGSAVDEAIRNLVCAGADPNHIALLDNFCWGNPTLPDRLGALVRAAQGCRDAALALQAPFISGKDSLYNEYAGEPIPGTLLISGIGIVPDVDRCMTAHAKHSGSLLFVLGDTRAELGGSLLHCLYGLSGGVSPVTEAAFGNRYRALHGLIRSGSVLSAHDASEGGLALAAVEMALAGRVGMDLDLTAVHADPWHALFSESNGRILIEVDPEAVGVVTEACRDLPLLRLGRLGGERVLMRHEGTVHVDAAVEALAACWRGAEV